ncbi:hypothetical protein HFO06_28740 [Rhizobium leguminosarum]|uniref:hypothetical protein n=1 Tax=Rhizobium leguminosarum TaxID=384 RepID=UPI001C940773|nr:hypothetical protein [Rhizobium leguminosarum]MBY5767038.1 hypothetical protein [Rhizobium leguminosarum]MBY5871324.1 hypothetical protein [Rhizobium leguminosarum]
MFELLGLLNTSYRTVASEMESWFAAFPAGAAWNVFSDYCIGDEKKANDAFAFAIVLNHDTQANIAEYISAVAPSDIKGSRTASEGLIRYLKCPVVFSISYIVERQSKMLRDYITDDNIIASLPDLRQVVALIVRDAPQSAAYYGAVDKRLAAFEQEMKRKKRNSNLARQIFLCAAFAAILFFHLNSKKDPRAIRWISDRDAMFDKFDKVTFDLAFIYFQLLRLQTGKVSFYPEILFGLPGWDGENHYNEFIRIPDYLAGTAADISLPSMTFTHEKFHPVFDNVFVDAPNAAIIEVLGSKEKITARRVGFSGPSRS